MIRVKMSTFEYGPPAERPYERPEINRSDVFEMVVETI